jgi:hypothetical protein
MTIVRLTDGSRAARRTLVLDLLALAAFIVVGMRSHRVGSQAEVFLRNAVPIGAAWLVAAFVLRTYRPPSLLALLRTWIVAIPVGVVLRAWWVGSPVGDQILVFVGVALVFTLAFLALGRVAAALVAARGRSDDPVA